MATDLPGPLSVLVAVGDDALADRLIEELQRQGLVAFVPPHHDGDIHIDVLLAEVPFPGWQAMQREGTSVIAFAEGASDAAVAALLATGADDVITRSDRPREVVARVRAVGRRRPATRSSDMPLGRIRVGDVELDTDSRRVTVRGREAHVTQTQFDLLAHLLLNAGRVVTRKSLLDNVWGPEATRDPNAIQQQVRRLRDAIELDPSNPSHLRTVPGVGYRFERE
jgi:two-component system response regulator RegX3